MQALHRDSSSVVNAPMKPEQQGDHRAARQQQLDRQIRAKFGEATHQAVEAPPALMRREQFHWLAFRSSLQRPSPLLHQRRTMDA
jgi:hypothetical protein